MIYLDYAATNPIDPTVADLMIACLLDPELSINASARHTAAQRAKDAIELARSQVAALINADPREIVWTSGATESNNLAIKGAAQSYARNGKHIVTTQIEHKSVLESARFLRDQGFRITYVKPHNGIVDPKDIEAAIQPDTILVSVMHVNNEIGTIQPIADIGAITRPRNIIFHVDAAQSAGKIPIDVDAASIDLLSLSAHKVYGPKGIGALYIRRKPKVSVQAQIHGGGQEKGLRSGTLPTCQIIGMGEAFRMAKDQFETSQSQLRELRRILLQHLKCLPGVTLNGDPEQRIPGNINIRIDGVDGERLISGLVEFVISSGSACIAQSMEPSYVLRALGLNAEQADSSIRITFGRFTTASELTRFADTLTQVVTLERQRHH